MLCNLCPETHTMLTAILRTFWRLLVCGNVGGGCDSTRIQGFLNFFYTHNRSITVRDPEIQTSWSNHIWDLKDENIQFSITFQVLQKSKSFNPIGVQCLLCLSEATQILINPNLATLNSRSETYGFCHHRKIYLLETLSL